MKYIGAVTLGLGLAGSIFAQQAKPQKMSKDEVTAIVSAGAGVGRRVCAVHPQESVWITLDGQTWNKYACSSLKPIFERNGSDLVKAYLEVLEILHGGKS